MDTRPCTCVGPRGVARLRRVAARSRGACGWRGTARRLRRARSRRLVRRRGRCGLVRLGALRRWLLGHGSLHVPGCAFRDEISSCPPSGTSEPPGPIQMITLRDRSHCTVVPPPALGTRGWSKPGMARWERPPQHRPRQRDARHDQRPGQCHPGDPECVDGPGQVQRHEDREPHQVLRHPDPTRAPVAAQQIRVPPPARPLSQSRADDQAEQRPAHDDRHRPGQRARGVRGDLQEEEVDRPARVEGDEHRDRHTEQPGQHRGGALAAREPDGPRGQPGAQRRGPAPEQGGRAAGGVGDPEPGDERDGSGRRVERAAATAEDLREGRSRSRGRRVGAPRGHEARVPYPPAGRRHRPGMTNATSDAYPNAELAVPNRATRRTEPRNSPHRAPTRELRACARRVARPRASGRLREPVY